MQPEILSRRGRRDRMAPRTTQPFHRPAVSGIAGGVFKRVEHVIQSHRPQTMKQGPGVFQHDPGLLALVNQLGEELAHPLVAPVENRGVVIIANPLVIHHVLEITDNRGSGQIPAACRNQRLVHMQGNGAGGANPAEINSAVGQKNRLVAIVEQGFFHEGFRTADVR